MKYEAIALALTALNAASAAPSGGTNDVFISANAGVSAGQASSTAAVGGEASAQAGVDMGATPTGTFDAPRETGTMSGWSWPTDSSASGGSSSGGGDLGNLLELYSKIVNSFPTGSVAPMSGFPMPTNLNGGSTNWEQLKQQWERQVDQVKKELEQAFDVEKNQRVFSRFNVTGNMLDIDAERKPEVMDNTRLNFQLSTDGVPRVNVRFFTDASDEAARMRVGLLRLVEVNDTISARQSRSALNLNMFASERWTPLSNGLTQEVVNGTSIHTVSSSLLFNDNPIYGNLNFTLALTVTNEEINNAAGVLLRPDSVKYSVFINNWKQRYENSRLLLIHALTVDDDDIKFEDSTNATVSLGGGRGIFNWASTCTADGVEVPVQIDETFRLIVAPSNETSDRLPRDIDEEDDNRVVHLIGFTFPMARSIDWDPEMGASPQYVAQYQASPNAIIADSASPSGNATDAGTSSSSATMATTTPSVVGGGGSTSSASTVALSFAGVCAAIAGLLF